MPDLASSPYPHTDEMPHNAAPVVWVSEVSRGNIFAVPVLYRVLIVNCIFLLVGALLGTALLSQTHSAARAPALVGFVITGLLLSIVVNFVLLKIAFHPLTRLRETMRRVQSGDMLLRAPITGYDPDADELAATFNAMVAALDELSRSRAAQILRAQEAERKRIARELHDETSQALTSLLISVAVLENQINDPETKEQIERVRAIAHQTLHAIRNLSIDLRPSALDDLGLLPALRWYIKEYQQKVGIPVDFSAQGFKHRYAPEAETALYRIVQEALTNSAKHAQATHISVALREGDGQAYVSIHDDGQGFDVATLLKAPMAERGLGLMGMRERAALLNGSVAIDSHPGGGTAIEVAIPLQKAEPKSDESFDE
jgi:two-component system, NarL family, sensor histidine kinase UhpB